MRSFKKIINRNESHHTAKAPDSAHAHDNDKSTKIIKKSGKLLKCIIRLLEDSQKPLEYLVSKDDLGQSVFTFVCRSIGDLTEYDYFGLRYRDKYDQEQWLDLSCSVFKQLRRSKLPELCFRLKHYPSDPIRDLKQNITRYLVYLQIRRDFSHGRLVCPQSMIGSLGALILQAEVGDAPLTTEPEKSHDSKNRESLDDDESNPSDNVTADSTAADTTRKYLKEFPIFHSQTTEHELKMIEEHQLLRGLTAQEAESELLSRVAHLPTYGIVPFPVTPHHKIDTTESGTDSSSGDLHKHSSLGRKTEKKHHLGISGNGLVTFVGVKKIQEFSWNEIQRLTCDGRQFVVCLKKEEPSILKRLLRGKTRLFTYDCESAAAALALWRWAVDRKCFFTLAEAKQAKRLRSSSSIFHRNQTYRFSGRSYHELSAIPNNVKQPQVIRVSSLRTSTRPELFQSKHATLPGRLRHSPSGQEELSDHTDLFNQKTVASNEISHAVLVPNTVIEQPMEEAPYDMEYLSKEPQIINKVTPTMTSAPNQTVGEMLVESKEALSSSAVPTADRKRGASITGTGQDAVEIRDRVDSTLVHSVVYEQVISALDQALDGHENKVVAADLPNGEIHRNGTCGDPVNGVLTKRPRKPGTLAEDERADTEVWGKGDAFLDRSKLAAVAVTIFVIIGLAVIIETTPTADFPVTRYLRSSLLITGFNNYIYTPVRNVIVSCLEAIWS